MKSVARLHICTRQKAYTEYPAHKLHLQTDWACGRSANFPFAVPVFPSVEVPLSLSLSLSLSLTHTRGEELRLRVSEIRVLRKTFGSNRGTREENYIVKSFTICTVHWILLGHPAGDVIGWGTALQTWRSRVRFPMASLEFSIDIILPAALWHWGWLSL